MEEHHDDYGEPAPPPRWLADLESWAADLRTWGLTGLVVWLAAIAICALLTVGGTILRAAG